jgi:hypothetical protein
MFIQLKMVKPTPYYKLKKLDQLRYKIKRDLERHECNMTCKNGELCSNPATIHGRCKRHAYIEKHTQYVLSYVPR